MEKHLEEIFDLQEKSIDFLINESGICCLNINLDLQAETWEMYWQELNSLGKIYNAIKSKALSEKMAYLETKQSLYERAIKLEFYEQAGEIKKEIDFFVHSFLEEIPAKYLGLPEKRNRSNKKLH